MLTKRNDMKSSGKILFYFLIFYCYLPLVSLPAWGGDILWRSVGPGGGGYITAIKCNLQNTNIVYAGSDVGGFYISYDQGETWEIRNKGLNDYYVQCIAPHPYNSDIIIIGTRGGIFKSTDAGKTWKWKRMGFPPPSPSKYSAPINSLAYDPQNPSIIYAGIGYLRRGKYGQGKIYKSINEGEDWRLCTPPGTLHPEAIVGDLKVAIDGSYILAITNKGIYRSSDKGVSWRKVNKGLPHLYCFKADISRSNPLICYVTLKTTAKGKKPWNGGVYKSINGGFTWSLHSNTLPRRVRKKIQTDKFSSMYKKIAIHPKNSDIIYVGADSWVTNGLYKTINGGKTWNQVLYRKSKDIEYGWLTSFAPVIKALAISNISPELIFCGTSVHIFRSLNDGKSWEQSYSTEFSEGLFKTNGLETTCVFNGVFDPHDLKRLYFCYADIGLLITDDFNDNYYRSFKGMNYKDDVTNVVVDPVDRDKIWACTATGKRGGVCQSIDRGETWQLIGSPDSGLPTGKIRTILIDHTSPEESRILYVTCLGYGIYKSGDDGLSWRAINNGLPKVARKAAVDVIINPNNPKNLRCLLGTSPADGSGIYETQNGGKNWQRISKPDAPFAMVRDLAVDPKNWNILYVCQFQKWIKKTFPGGVYNSIDGGKTWRRIFLKFKKVECIAISPVNSNIIYLGTCDHPFHDNCRAPGVFKSKNGGITWYQENNGLTNTQITSLSISPHDPSILLLGTNGNGMFIGNDKEIGKRPPSRLLLD